MSRYSELKSELAATPRVWLVTGAAGFIGSHLVEELLALGQTVRGLDNLSTGHLENLDDVRARCEPEAWRRFEFIEGDLADVDLLHRAVRGVDLVLHQAALGSVPRSVENPLATHAANATGFVNLLHACVEAKVPRCVYASSSSVYGDHPELPKREDKIGEPLSPYAASKRVDEIYAGVFQRTYGIQTAGMRYFNVVGTRQDPNGAYAAVVPRWVSTLQAGERPIINGDGSTSRDFCPVANVVQANLLAATSGAEATGRSYNVGLGGRTTLLELFALLRDLVAARGHVPADLEPEFRDFRVGDVKHSLADISAARELLGYEPEVDLGTALADLVAWYEVASVEASR